MVAGGDWNSKPNAVYMHFQRERLSEKKLREITRLAGELDVPVLIHAATIPSKVIETDVKEFAQELAIKSKSLMD